MEASYMLRILTAPQYYLFSHERHLGPKPALKLESSATYFYEIK